MGEWASFEIHIAGDLYTHTVFFSEPVASLEAAAAAETSSVPHTDTAASAIKETAADLVDAVGEQLFRIFILVGNRRLPNVSYKKNYIEILNNLII
jgi:hypothetical protein